MTQPVTVIGSAAPSDLIVRAPGLSDTHAQIEFRQDGCYVVDLGSAQGTRVNSRRIKQSRLEQGDIIQLGSVTLQFEPIFLENNFGEAADHKTTAIDLSAFSSDAAKSSPTKPIQQPGDQIGRYIVQGNLGSRGHYTVYQAYDPDLDRAVAIKLLSPRFVTDSSFRAQVLGEVKLIAALDHPCIVQVYDYGEHQEQPYVVMPLMAGGTLMAALGKGAFSLQQMQPIITRIAEALDDAHARGIIHRQLKPRNILFDEQGLAYLSDFAIPSLEAVLSAELDDELVHYISPEQAQALRDKQPAQLDGRSDIYSLGAILFEALTGQPPFQAESSLDTALTRLNTPAPRLAAVKPDLPFTFQRIFDLSMGFDSHSRYAKASDMARHIRDILTGRGFLQQLKDDPSDKFGTSDKSDESKVAKELQQTSSELSGAAIGRYQVERELGRGGMAVVYLAFDPVIVRHVAIKVLPRRLTENPGFRELFQREARIVARLRHESVVGLYDFGEYNAQPFIVMQYLPGGTLAQQLAQGPIRMRNLSMIVERVAAALDEAHKMQIIHRDVKPANILFNAERQAFLSDFGIAVLSAAASETAGGWFAAGTPDYLSPEQAQELLGKGHTQLSGPRQFWHALKDRLGISHQEKEKRASTPAGVDARSDIYSLGVVIFHALTGRPPFRAETPHQVAMMHLTAPIPSLAELTSGLPKHCQAIIDRAMAKNPDERYQTGKELADDLSELATGRWLLRQISD
ncbi:MAG: protein kinase [Anaerolineae bacterium]|nr:protein kinase [Anaerolineae bacterium]